MLSERGRSIPNPLANQAPRREPPRRSWVAAGRPGRARPRFPGRDVGQGGGGVSMLRRGAWAHGAKAAIPGPSTSWRTRKARQARQLRCLGVRWLATAFRFAQALSPSRITPASRDEVLLAPTQEPKKSHKGTGILKQFYRRERSERSPWVPAAIRILGQLEHPQQVSVDAPEDTGLAKYEALEFAGPSPDPAWRRAAALVYRGDRHGGFILPANEPGDRVGLQRERRSPLSDQLQQLVVAVHLVVSHPVGGDLGEELSGTVDLGFLDRAEFEL